MCGKDENIQNRRFFQQQADIYFIEKQPKATLETVLCHLDLTSFSEEQKKEYIHSENEEQRRKFLMEAFIRQNQEEYDNEPSYWSLFFENISLLFLFSFCTMY